MASRSTKFFSLRDFTRGLVLQRPASSLRSGEAAIAENVDLENNTLKRRKGWAKVNADTPPSGSIEPLRSLYPYYPEGAGTPRLFVVAGTHLMFSEGGDLSSISTDLTPGPFSYADFAAAQSTVYLATRYGDNDTAQTLRKWTSGGGLETVASTPAAKFVTVFEQALFAMGGNASEDSRVWWSRSFPNQEKKTDNTTGWPALNFVDVQPGDGDRITGYGKLMNALIVFKERSIHRITGTPPDDASLEEGGLSVYSYDEPNGCVSPDSVAVGHNLVIYLNRKGIYGFDGVRAQELSEPIRPLFDTLNEGQLKRAAGYLIEPYHYVLSVTSGDSTVPDLIISMRLSPNRVFTVWKGIQAHSVSNFQFSGTSVPVLGLPGNLGRLDGETDNGEWVTWKYRTGALDLGDDPFRKMVRRGWITTAPKRGSLDVTLLADHAQEGVTVTVDTGSAHTADEHAKRWALPGFGIADRWALQLEGTGDGPPQEVQEVLLEVSTRK